LLKIAHKFNRAGFTTRRDAEAYGRHIQPLISRLRRALVELGHTLGELIERYTTEALPRLNRKDRAARPRQLNWWKRQFGSESLIASVTPPRISRALRELSRQSPLHAPRAKVQPTKNDGRTRGPLAALSSGDSSVAITDCLGFLAVLTSFRRRPQHGSHDL
jgi:hypothetical protein